MASLGQNPSYMWRSISNAKFIVQTLGEHTPPISEVEEPWLSYGLSISASTQGIKCEYENTLDSTSLQE